jgi:hypothetical protein
MIAINSGRQQRHLHDNASLSIFSCKIITAGAANMLTSYPHSTNSAARIAHTTTVHASLCTLANWRMSTDLKVILCPPQTQLQGACENW